MSDGVTITGLAETVLPFRTSEYIAGLCDKLSEEGITSPADLTLTSREALEMKLSTHAAFNFIEMADTLNLRQYVTREGINCAGGSGSRPSSAEPKGRAGESGGRRPRSRSPQGYRRREPREREHSRPLRGRERQGPRGVPSRDKPEKPKLWSAIELGDEATAKRLLNEGADPEEKYLSWSPLLKAAEEGHTEIIKCLLEKKADLEVSNKKGRTALSFAAAPSMKRPTPTAALRLLLERGADPGHKDDMGVTPKARAAKEKRDDAVAIFIEFEKDDVKM